MTRTDDQTTSFFQFKYDVVRHCIDILDLLAKPVAEPYESILEFDQRLRVTEARAPGHLRWKDELRPSMNEQPDLIAQAHMSALLIQKAVLGMNLRFAVAKSLC